MILQTTVVLIVYMRYVCATGAFSLHHIHHQNASARAQICFVNVISDYLDLPIVNPLSFQFVQS